VITGNCNSESHTFYPAFGPTRLVMTCRGERARDPSGLAHKPSALERVSDNDDKMAAAHGVYIVTLMTDYERSWELCQLVLRKALRCACKGYKHA
jgi:hypothetical protein